MAMRTLRIEAALCARELPSGREVQTKVGGLFESECNGENQKV